MAYVSGLQSQTSQAELEAQSTFSRKGAENLVFTVGQLGLTATNSGPATLALTYVVLRFPNGTVYPLSVSAVIPTGGRASVRGLVPSGVCTPGTATCLSKYNQIVAGNPPGSSVGLVTSLGNSFWYAYSSSLVNWNSITGFPKACPGGQTVNQINTTLTCVSGGAAGFWLKGAVSTSGTGAYSSTGLSVALAANTAYAFTVFTSIEPFFGTEGYNFEVHSLPAGATLVIACTPMSYPTAAVNQPTNCVTSSGTPIALNNNLGFGTSPPIFADPGIWGLVIVGGMAVTLQIDFACTSNCGRVTMQAGSFILAQPVT